MYFTSNPPVIDSLGGSFISETKPSPRFLHDPDHNSALVTDPGCFERAQRHNTRFRFRFWACRGSATLERRTACAMSAHGMPCWASRTPCSSRWSTTRSRTCWWLGFGPRGGRGVVAECDCGPVQVMTAVMVGVVGGLWTRARSRRCLGADAPRVSCRRHGVVVAAVPWARHGAGHTYAFDDTVAWLTVRCSKTAVRELMRVGWRTVGPIITRVSADAADWITDVVAQRCPVAVQCADPFHVVKWATEALDEVRRGVWNSARAVARTEPGRRRGRPRADAAPRPGHERARRLKNNRYALWKNPQNLTVKQSASWSGSPRPTPGCTGPTCSRRACV